MAEKKQKITLFRNVPLAVSQNSVTLHVENFFVHHRSATNVNRIDTTRKNHETRENANKHFATSSFLLFKEHSSTNAQPVDVFPKSLACFRDGGVVCTRDLQQFCCPRSEHELLPQRFDLNVSHLSFVTLASVSNVRPSDPNHAPTTTVPVRRRPPCLRRTRRPRRCSLPAHRPAMSTALRSSVNPSQAFAHWPTSGHGDLPSRSPTWLSLRFALWPWG